MAHLAVVRKPAERSGGRAAEGEQVRVQRLQLLCGGWRELLNHLAFGGSRGLFQVHPRRVDRVAALRQSLVQVVLHHRVGRRDQDPDPQPVIEPRPFSTHRYASSLSYTFFSSFYTRDGPCLNLLLEHHQRHRRSLRLPRSPARAPTLA
jgi:hypothetical protein